MTDERLRRWLEVAEQPLAPDARLRGRAPGRAAQELGFVPAQHACRRSTRRIGGARVRGRRGPTQLLLVAALLVAGRSGLTAVAGSLLERSIEPQPNLLTEIAQTGRIRIADQARSSAVQRPRPAGGRLRRRCGPGLADHLGVRGDIVLVDAAAMLSGQTTISGTSPCRPWRSGSSTRSRFLVSAPYYRWPHRLVVPEASSATGPADLAGEPICAVAGDAGEAWLRGATATRRRRRSRSQDRDPDERRGVPGCAGRGRGGRGRHRPPVRRGPPGSSRDQGHRRAGTRTAAGDHPQSPGRVTRTDRVCSPRSMTRSTRCAATGP